MRSRSRRSSRDRVALVGVAVELDHLGAVALGRRALVGGASFGMRIVACGPCSAAASATACAWLPDERRDAAARSRASAATALYAPRNLNAPTRWRFSALRWTRAPRARRACARSDTGVRCATPRRRSAAARTSSMPIGRRSVCVAMSARAGEEAASRDASRRPCTRRCARTRGGCGGRRSVARDERALGVLKICEHAVRVRPAREKPAIRRAVAHARRAPTARRKPSASSAARGAAQMRDVTRAGRGRERDGQATASSSRRRLRRRLRRARTRTRRRRPRR